jgi:RNA polymerase sigma-70 factor (sigma-E family)
MRSAVRQKEFVAFVQEHRTDLLRTASLLCLGDQAAAEDIVQTTLTKLFVSWTRARKARSTLAYARASLVHAFIDESRRSYRRHEYGVDDVASHISTGPDADSDASLRLTVLQALDCLTPGQRAVVVLRHWLDLDVRSTAEILSCSTGTVKSQNARALASMKLRLAESQSSFPK